MFTNKTSLIIPTKNRSNELISLIQKLVIFNFNEILVVDSSEFNHSEKIKNKCIEENILYFHTKSSTSFQRNFGMKKIKQNKFVMFMDDDVTLFDDTFTKMNQCINQYSEHNNIAGFGFNQIQDHQISFFETLKKKKIFKFLNIYPDSPGKVAKSGWHSKILNLKKDVLGDWVFTTICIFKHEDIKYFSFDETFGQYSYLEDLDFSLNLMKKNKKILISSSSKFSHPHNIDRSGFDFGITEIKNRYRIVSKHNLSKKLFFIGVLLRFFISLIKSFPFNKKYFFRCLGNMYCIFSLKIFK